MTYRQTEPVLLLKSGWRNRKVKDRLCLPLVDSFASTFTLRDYGLHSFQIPVRYAERICMFYTLRRKNMYVLQILQLVRIGMFDLILYQYLLLESSWAFGQGQEWATTMTCPIWSAMCDPQQTFGRDAFGHVFQCVSMCFCFCESCFQFKYYNVSWASRAPTHALRSNVAVLTFLTSLQVAVPVVFFSVRKKNQKKIRALVKICYCAWSSKNLKEHFRCRPPRRPFALSRGKTWKGNVKPKWMSCSQNSRPIAHGHSSSLVDHFLRTSPEISQASRKSELQELKSRGVTIEDKQKAGSRRTVDFRTDLLQFSSWPTWLVSDTAIGARVQKLDTCHVSCLMSHDFIWFSSWCVSNREISLPSAEPRCGLVQMGGEVLFPAGLRLQVRGAVSTSKSATDSAVWITRSPKISTDYDYKVIVRI